MGKRFKIWGPSRSAASSKSKHATEPELTPPLELLKKAHSPPEVDQFTVETSQPTTDRPPRASPSSRNSAPPRKVNEPPRRAISLPSRSLYSRSPPSSSPPSSTPQADPSAAKSSTRWFKVRTRGSRGPASGYQGALEAFKPPLDLALLEMGNYHPKSPIAWFIDELGISILKVIPRQSLGHVHHHYEYELGDLKISKSATVPLGFREPWLSEHAVPEATWRTIPIFTTPVRKDPLRMTHACESIHGRADRITIAFKVFFLDINEDDRYSRVFYEESWTYYNFDEETLEVFYQQYKDVLCRTIEDHRTVREYYMGPWKDDDPAEGKVPKMYEESKKFLGVD